MAKLILFTGKGGVGKSTTSAASAFHYASQGFKTLLVSSDPAHSTEDVVGIPIGNEPTPVRENMWAMNIQADIKAKEFQKTLMEQMDSTVVKWFPGFDAEILTDWASFPGIDEVFALEEIMNLVQSVEYDVVVFDTAPTGHTLKALTAPDAFNKFLLRILRMKSRVAGLKSIFLKKSDTDELVRVLEDATRKIDNFKKLLRNHDFVNINLVSIATEAGYQECLKTVNFLEAQGFTIDNIVVNNLIPPFDEDTWKLSSSNKAVALLYNERNNQQPYVEKYHHYTMEMGVTLIGVSKLPFEPRGEKLLEFGNFLKKLKFTPECCQVWDLEGGSATLRLKFPHSGNVKLKETSYIIDGSEYEFEIPPEYRIMKIRKTKTSSGATYTFK